MKIRQAFDKNSNLLYYLKIIKTVPCKEKEKGELKMKVVQILFFLLLLTFPATAKQSYRIDVDTLNDNYRSELIDALNDNDFVAALDIIQQLPTSTRRLKQGLIATALLRLPETTAEFMLKELGYSPIPKPTNSKITSILEFIEGDNFSFYVGGYSVLIIKYGVEGGVKTPFVVYEHISPLASH